MNISGDYYTCNTIGGRKNGKESAIRVFQWKVLRIPARQHVKVHEVVEVADESVLPPPGQIGLG